MTIDRAAANGTVHHAGDGCLAYVQRDGSWGWSNAGLVVGDGQSLLVDTLFDLRVTAEMLEAFAAQTRSAPIATVVNTHANGDHCYGNELVAGAEIVAVGGGRRRDGRGAAGHAGGADLGAG